MCVLIYFACLVSIWCIEAATINELKKEFLEKVIECSQKYPLAAEDLQQTQNGEMPDKEAIKCLFACTYKKTGIMDEKGMLDVDKSNEIVQTFFANDPEQLKKGLAFTEACKSVNDAPVTDGDRGCDRAALLFKCTHENLPVLGGE